MTKTREWLLYNAVLTWLHHYDLSENASDFTDEYRLLAEELKESYEQSNNTKTRKRGRPAKRQRTQKATSNPSSTETSKTTNQEA